MLISTYRALAAGDLVRHKMSGDACRVLEVVKGVPVVARVRTMHNPDEWDLVSASGAVIDGAGYSVGRAVDSTGAEATFDG